MSTRDAMREQVERIIEPDEYEDGRLVARSWFTRDKAARILTEVIEPEIAALKAEIAELRRNATDDAFVKRILEMPSEELLKLVPQEELDANAREMKWITRSAIAEAALSAEREKTAKLREALEFYGIR